MARLARRPLLEGAEFKSLKIVQEMQTMTPRQLTQVVRGGLAVLDRVNRSIFMGNVAKVMRCTKQATFVKVTVKSVIMNSKDAQEKTRAELGRVARRWSGRGEVVFFHLSTTGTAAPSIQSLLGNTKAWEKAGPADFL